MLIGVVLASGAVWAGLGSPRWGEQVPTFFIGLALASFGYSMVSRARRAARRRH